MTTAQVVETATPAWRGGFGRLWSAAVLSRFGDALRTAALPLLAVRLIAMTGRVSAAFRIALRPAVPTLIPARSADVSKGEKGTGVTTGSCPT